MYLSKECGKIYPHVPMYIKKLSKPSSFTIQRETGSIYLKWMGLLTYLEGINGYGFETFLLVSTMPCKKINLPYSIHKLNKFLTANQKTSYRSWLFTSLRFFWHLLRPNWSIIWGTVSLWKMFQNGQIATLEGKCHQFRILTKVESLMSHWVTVPRIHSRNFY